jgi:hypothetical protein
VGTAAVQGLARGRARDEEDEPRPDRAQSSELLKAVLWQHSTESSFPRFACVNRVVSDASGLRAVTRPKRFGHNRTRSTIAEAEITQR